MSKIDIISGFLGAGKTTLIQKLIKEVYAGQKVVLIENEFGEIGIDGGFLQDAGIEITEINSGCICCTLKGDFEIALKQVIDTYNPDHIIIEPSGVGKLSDILKAVKSVDGVDLNSYSTVVDAKRCEIYHKNFKEFFDDQIQTANCIILSRTQQVDDDKLQKDLDIIHELNEDARVITTPWDDLSGKAIVEAMEGSTDGFPELPYDEDEDEVCEIHHHHDHDEEHEHHHHDHDEEHEHHHHHHHDEEHHHDHDHHHHIDEEAVNEGLSEGNRIRVGSDEHEHHHHHHDADEVFDSIGIETINKYSEEFLQTALEKLPDTIVRAKGIVPTEDGEWLFFDYVPGDVELRKGSPAYTGLITIIGEKIDVELMKELFEVK